MISPDPRGMNWDTYCNLMTELFSTNSIGNVPEDKWKDWVASINGLGYFSSQGIPDSGLYKNWQDWAKAMCGIMNVTTDQV
jgi:hypothetical protein